MTSRGRGSVLLPRLWFSVLWTLTAFCLLYSGPTWLCLGFLHEAWKLETGSWGNHRAHFCLLSVRDRCPYLLNAEWLENHSDGSVPNSGFPHDKQFSNTSWVTYNLILFWHYLPRDGIRPHKWRAQSHKSTSLSDASGKPRLSPVLVTDQLPPQVPVIC